MALTMRLLDASGWKPCRVCRGEEWVGDLLCPWCYGSGDDIRALAPDGDPPDLEPEPEDDGLDLLDPPEG